MEPLYKSYHELIPQVMGPDVPIKNNQLLATAIKCKLFPAWFNNDGNYWMYHVQGFKRFCEFRETQKKRNEVGFTNDDPLYFINHIRFGSVEPYIEALDFTCPFSIFQIGRLFSLNAINGVAKSKGANKKRRRIYASSYWHLIDFRNETINLYFEEFKRNGYQKNTAQSSKKLIKKL